VKGKAPAYQWRRNGADVQGATSSSYTTPATAAGDSGATFSVLVTSGSRTLTSRNALLTVNVPPAITAQPVNATVMAGQTAAFTVVATGSGTLAYQWRRNGTSIGGATSSSYTTPATVIGDDGAQYSVVVSSASGSATSATAVLTVTAAPPPPVAGTWGPTASLEALATGGSELSVAISRETGDGIVVWTQVDNGLSGVYASRYHFQANSWSGTELIGVSADTSNNENVYYPKAAINSAGDIVVAWLQNINKSGTTGTARAARYKPGVGWSTAYILTRIPGGPEPAITWTYDVAVAMDFAGHATVLWTEEYDSVGAVLVASARMPVNDVPQTAVLLESTQDAVASENVRVVMDSVGNSMAAWIRQKAPFDSGEQIVTQRRAAVSGAWDAEVVVADVSNTANLNYPDMAVNPTSGDILLAWRLQAGGGGTAYDLRLSRYIAAQAQWTPAASAESDPVNVGTISVALNKLGQAAIAWARSGDATTDVRVERVDMASGTIGPVVALSATADEPSIGIDMAGNIMAVFLQPDSGTSNRLSARRVLADDSLGFTSRLSELGTDSYFGSVAVADDGTALAGWVDGGNVSARVFR
jgi:hypothetical protein